MEKRKLQKTGRNTLIVSLPKKWIKENNLNKGDYVFLYPKGNALIIKTKAKKKTKYCELVFSGKEETFRELVARYVQGYEKIKITAHAKEWKELKIIREYALRKLSGIEITDLQNGLIIEVILGNKSRGLENVLERVRSTLEWIVSAMKEGVRESDRELLREIAEKDDEIDRLNLLASREIFEILEISQDSRKLVYLKILLDKLESIGDSLQAIAKTLEENIDSIPKNEFLLVLKKLEENLSLIFSAYFKNDKNTANMLIEKSFLFSKKTLSVLRVKYSFSEARTILLENFSRIAQLCKEAGECILDSL